MEKTLLAISRGTRKIEDTMQLLIDKGITLQRISIIIPESTDLPQNYFQKLNLIDTVAGERIGINAVAVPGVEDLILFGGPVAQLLGVNETNDTEESDNTVIGTLAGGMLNAFMDIGVSEETAKKYVEGLNSGSLILGVSISEDQQKLVEDIFNETDLEDVIAIGE